MKVTYKPNMTFVPRIAVQKVNIELDDMEAGFLRSFLNRYSEPAPLDGFAGKLVKELSKYRFPAHEEHYGDWDERENR